MAAGTVILNESADFTQTINANRAGGSHNIWLQNGTSTILNNGGQLNVISTQSNGRILGVATANVTLVVDGSGNTLLGGNTTLGMPTAFLQNSATSGTLTLSKTGSGTVILNANSTYSGGTTISGGTLLATNASGSATGSGSVTVSGGGALGGTGLIAGSVIVDNGGILSPGASIGSLGVGSSEWNDDTTFVMEFSTDGSTGSAGVQWDRLAITGSLDLTGLTSTTLNLVTMADATNPGLLGSWNPNINHEWAGFVTTTTGITGFDANVFDFNTSGFQNLFNGTFHVEQSGNNLNLVYTAVPEPATLVLATASLIGLAAIIRRASSRQRRISSDSASPR